MSSISVESKLSSGPIGAGRAARARTTWGQDYAQSNEWSDLTLSINLVFELKLTLATSDHSACDSCTGLSDSAKRRMADELITGPTGAQRSQADRLSL